MWVSTLLLGIEIPQTGSQFLLPCKKCQPTSTLSYQSQKIEPVVFNKSTQCGPCSSLANELWIKDNHLSNEDGLFPSLVAFDPLWSIQIMRSIGTFNCLHQPFDILLLLHGFFFHYPTIGKEQLNVIAILKAHRPQQIELQSLHHTKKMNSRLNFPIHSWYFN